MAGHSAIQKQRSVRVTIRGLLATACLLVGANIAHAAPIEAGWKLERALRALQQDGLRLVYSKRLVRSSFRIQEQPQGPARQQLDQILEAHGLRAQETAEGVLVVVAAHNQEVPLTLKGVVYSAHSGAPLSAATVSILEFQQIGQDASGGSPSTAAAARSRESTASGPSGRFRFEGLLPGIYLVEAHRDDHLPERASVLVQEIGPAASAEPLTRLELLPRAFLNEEIAVRSSENRLLSEPGAAPISLDRDEVEALPRLGNDLFRALSLLPGVQSNDLSAQPRIRGGRPDELRVVLDGQELYGAYHLQDFDNGLSVVAAEDLRQADLITGSFSAEHGDRLGGVLDLRTKHIDKVSARLGLSAVSLEASLSGTFWDEQGSWSGTARRGSLEFVNKIFGQENPSFWDALGKVELRLGDNQELSGHGLSARDTLDFTETVVDGEDVELDQLTTEYHNDHFWLTHQTVLGSKVLVVTSVAHSELTRDRNGLEQAEEQDLELSDRRQLEVDEIRQQWSLQATTDHALSWGGEFREYESFFSYESNAERELTTIGLEVLPSTPPTSFEAEFKGQHAGLFVSDRLRRGRFTLELGARVDRYSKSLLPAGSSETTWSPRTNLALQLSDHSVIRLGFGTFHQSQRPYEIAVEDGQTAPSKTEKSQQWILGYEQQFTQSGQGQLRVAGLRVEAYRRRVEDPRLRFVNVFEPFNTLRELEPDRVGIAPLKTRSDGVEVLLDGTIGDRTNWWFNYAHSRAEDRLRSSIGAGRYAPRETDQPHAAALTISWQLPREWQLSSALRFHTGWPTTPASLAFADEESRTDLGSLETNDVGALEGDDEDENDGNDGNDDGEEDDPAGLLQLGQLNSQRLADYYRLDLRLSKTWALSRGELTFFVDIQNLTDRKNQSGKDHSIDDGQLTVDIESWPGIFPSLGLRWSF